MKSDAAEVRCWHDATGHAHASVLRWYRSVGYARHRGVAVDMREAPAIAGQDIEYLGGVRGRIDGREMTHEELLFVRELLEKMAQEARDALAGASTLVVVGSR